MAPMRCRLKLGSSLLYRSGTWRDPSLINVVSLATCMHISLWGPSSNCTSRLVIRITGEPRSYSRKCYERSRASKLSLSPKLAPTSSLRRSQCHYGFLPFWLCLSHSHPCIQSGLALYSLNLGVSSSKAYRHPRRRLQIHGLCDEEPPKCCWHIRRSFATRESAGCRVEELSLEGCLGVTEKDFEKLKNGTSLRVESRETVTVGDLED
ncbi:hypothetical protein BXZ70DRAFT_682655 [Cristinia sonorae]|uniref:Uncharacterized protein n=1 Tax=Cristinia sonorae TaxID=1940300 RepID=A0A8K0UVF1_9AGAR|nr:hypothetical protein BXZ70DRAFT_682655 [Cristinia sonorae]